MVRIGEWATFVGFTVLWPLVPFRPEGFLAPAGGRFWQLSDASSQQPRALHPRWPLSLGAPYPKTDCPGELESQLLMPIWDDSEGPSSLWLLLSLPRPH